MVAFRNDDDDGNVLFVNIAKVSVIVYRKTATINDQSDNTDKYDRKDLLNRIEYLVAIFRMIFIQFELSSIKD